MSMAQTIEYYNDHPSGLRVDQMQIKIEDYGVSRETGFVPARPSQRLPHSYEAWERLADDLSIKLKSGAFLDELNLLPAISLEALCDEHQWERAYIVLAFLVHALVHGCHRSTIPSTLSEPFLAVCDHLDVPPVLSYAGLCLYNWSKSDDQNILQGLRTEMSFTGTLDEAAFYLVPVLTELVGGRLPALLWDTLAAAAEEKWATVTQTLETCSATFVNMTEAFAQLSLCDPEIFYNQVRPYIAGLDVDFERSTGPPLHVQVIGGSAVQSAYFPFLDRLLGVSHNNQILEDMKQFMPSGHRRLLKEALEQPSLLDLIETKNAPAEVRSSLTDCRCQLQNWRSRHVAVVTRYIVLPAQAAARNKHAKSVQVAGTAGSSPLSFLKQMRNDTPL